MGQVQKRRPMSDINVVPYIDVMLVLLIIFMVTAPMLTQGIKVDLPIVDSSPVNDLATNPPLIISVDANRAYYLETGDSASTPMELAQITERVTSAMNANPKTQVLVRGDRHVEYGVVVDLMAALQRAGAGGVGLVTEDPQ